MRSLRRRLPCALALLIVGWGCAPPPRPSFPITVVAAPGPFGEVAEAAVAEDRAEWRDGDSRDDDACTESFAALELRRGLARVLGVPESTIALATPASLPARGDVFVLGSRRSNPLVGSLLRGEPPPAGPEDFRLRALSRGRRSLFVVEGGGRQGTLYGAYALLETLGMRFYGLGDAGAAHPPGPPAWPRKLRAGAAPAFETRGFWAFEPRGGDEFFLWMARNRLNLWTDAAPHPARLKKLGIRLAAGGHMVQTDYLDPRAHFAEHPEWYGLQGASRSPDLRGEAGDNFCTSNPEAVSVFAEGIARDLVQGRLRNADVMNVWPLDGGRWCECSPCSAQGSPAERWLRVTRRVSAVVEGARRDAGLHGVEVVAPAYLETLAPPRAAASPVSGQGPVTVTFFPYFRCYAHALADPACREVNRRLAAALEGWGREIASWPAAALGVGEYYNVSTFKSLPLIFPHVMAADLAAYRRRGVREIHYMHALTGGWGSWTLQHALYARLLWNPDAPVDSLLDDFIARYYPAAAGPMSDYYRQLEIASANVLALKHCVGAFGTGPSTRGGRLGDDRFPVFALRHLRLSERSAPGDGAPSLVEIEQATAAARRALDRARAAASDTLEAARLADEARRFAYGEATLALYSALIRTALADRQGDAAAARLAFAPADSLAERLAGMRDVVKGAGIHADASDALDAAQVGATLEHFGKLYGVKRR